MTVVPIIPTLWREPFDADGWTLELKYEGFRGIADTVNGRMLSKRGNRMKRFEGLLAALPAGCIFDGEIAAIDQYGRPRFRALLFDRGPPAYVVFDVLQAGGEDLRGRPLRERKAVLAQFALGALGWIAITDAVVGEGPRLRQLVVFSRVQVCALASAGWTVHRDR